jgi:hypothetical protein
MVEAAQLPQYSQRVIRSDNQDSLILNKNLVTGARLSLVNWANRSQISPGGKTRK